MLWFTSCEILEPEVANVYTMEDAKNVVNIAEGILLTAYRDLPTNHSNFTLAYGSDDAVTNNRRRIPQALHTVCQFQGHGTVEKLGFRVLKNQPYIIQKVAHRSILRG